MVFPASSQLTAKDFAARVLAYMDDLGEYPKEIVSEAIREARRGAQTFCPSIKDIRDAASGARTARFGGPSPRELPDPMMPAKICTPEQAAEIMARYKRMPRSDGEMSQTEFERRKAKMLEDIDKWMRDRGYDWPPPDLHIPPPKPSHS